MRFACTGAGLATIIPNTFAAAGNIEGSAPGPSLAVVTTAGRVRLPCRSAPNGFVAQLWVPFALRYGSFVVLSGLSAFTSTSMKRTSLLQKNPLRSNQSSAEVPSRWLVGSGKQYAPSMSPTSMLLRKAHRLRVALDPAASLFERYPAEGTPKLSVYREVQRASNMRVSVKGR